MAVMALPSLITRTTDKVTTSEELPERRDFNVMGAAELKVNGRP